MAKEPTVKLKIELPDHERGRSPQDIARLEVLNARLSKPPKARGRMSADEARTADLKERERIEHGPSERADQAWARDAIEETKALAVLRGEDMAERDGLMSLFRRERLTPEEYDLGIEVRACYEARNADVGSQLGSVSIGAAHDNDRYVMARAKRARKLWALGKTEIALAVECKDEPACLQLMRAVVGEGVTLSAFGRGRAFERNLKALLRALRIYERIRDTGR